MFEELESAVAAAAEAFGEFRSDPSGENAVAFQSAFMEAISAGDDAGIGYDDVKDMIELAAL